MQSAGEKRFGRYVLEQRLAVGGMAEVFRARLDDNGFVKPVCIKRILPQLAGTKGFADMLRDEASLAARLAHVNLVQALDFGSVDGTLYIAMELVDGATLARCARVMRKAGETFPIARALHIGACMCRGLYYAHNAVGSDGKPIGFVHRDVSPQNVLLGRDGVVKVGDFGVARATERLSRTATGQVKGKPQYMAPEQALAEESDHRVDQFATAIVLWELLAGRDLFRRDSMLATLDAVASAEVPPLARKDVSVTLEAALRKALSREPHKRFADMAAFEAALNEELAELSPKPADLDVRPMVARTIGVAAEAVTDVTLEHPHALDPPSETTSEGVWQSGEGEDTERVKSQRRPGVADREPLMPDDDEPTHRLPPPPTLPTASRASPALESAATVPARMSSSSPRRRPASQTSARAPAASTDRLPIPLWALAVSAAVLLVAGISIAIATSRGNNIALTPPPAPPPPAIVTSAAAPATTTAPGPSEAPPSNNAAAPEAAAEPGDDHAVPEPKPKLDVAKSAAHKVPLGEALKNAKSALLQKDASSAIELLSPYDTSKDADVHRLLGVAYAQKHMTQLAAKHYREYLTLKPDAPDAEMVKKILDNAPR